MKDWPRLRQVRRSLRRRLSPPSKPQLLHWARQVRSAVQPTVVASIGMKKYVGQRQYDPSLPNLIVVSHEASATGAPILVWNLCQYFSRSHNIVVLMLRDGAMIPDFQDFSIAVLRARQELVITDQLKRELHHLLGPDQPKIAIVNSIVSNPFIKPLRSLGIGVVSLIHEFPSSLRPAHLFTDIGIWSTRLVFSSDLTRDDLYRTFPQLQALRTDVLAQGPCKRPDRPGRVAAAQPLVAGLDAEDFLAGLKSNTLFVLAAGEVQPRKGVDLFIAVADQIRRMCPELQIKFAWIGCGYDPLYDTQLSLWLQDQIIRSGLEADLKMLEHSSAYKDLLERCDLFLMTSRLDPLPNVAVDALLAGKPVLCFENACGIASILLKDPELGPAWVAPYFDVHAMAAQASVMLTNRERCSVLTHRSRQLASQWFDMPTYCQQLATIVEQTLEEVSDEHQCVSQLMQLQLIDPGYAFPAASPDPGLATMEYVLSWRQSVWPRKPSPGLHPGIYREQCLHGNAAIDPTLHWHQSGCPDGPWKSTVLIGKEMPVALDQSIRAALHIHVTRIEVLPSILDLICRNSLRPEIFITSNDDSIDELLAAEHGKRGLILKDHLVVPRRGRDMAALLLGLQDRLDHGYTFYGHIHTSHEHGIANSNPELYQRFLLFNLIGNKTFGMMDQIASGFMEDPSLGLVFPADPVCFDGKATRSSVQALITKLQLSDSPQWLNYPVGSMFWVRPEAMRSYQKLNFDWSDYPSDLFDHQSTLIDAIQRTMPLAVEQAGFKIIETWLPGCTR